MLKHKDVRGFFEEAGVLTVSYTNGCFKVDLREMQF